MGKESGMNRRKPGHIEKHSLTVGAAGSIPDAGFDETGFYTLSLGTESGEEVQV